MSHRAVNWALEQRHLKPGPWIVLIQLADRHNKDTRRVCPYQATLANDCNMPRSSINNHLVALEKLGLIRRVQRLDFATKRQLATFYILGLDFDNPPEIDHAVSKIETRDNTDQKGIIESSRVQNPDMGAVSKKHPDPCPKNGPTRVQNPDTKKNHVKEPVSEPIGGGGSARENAKSPDLGKTQNASVAENPPSMPPPRFIRENLLKVMGFDGSGVTPNGRIVGSGTDMIELNRWRDDLGLTDAEVLQVASDVCQSKRDGPPRSFRYFRAAMQRFAAEKSTPSITPDAGGQNGPSHTDRATRAEIRMRAFIAGARRTS